MMSLHCKKIACTHSFINLTVFYRKNNTLYRAPLLSPFIILHWSLVTLLNPCRSVFKALVSLTSVTSSASFPSKQRMGLEGTESLILDAHVESRHTSVSGWYNNVTLTLKPYLGGFTFYLTTIQEVLCL